MGLINVAIYYVGILGLMLWVGVGLGSGVLCNLAGVSPFPQNFKLTIGQILEDKGIAFFRERYTR